MVESRRKSSTPGAAAGTAPKEKGKKAAGSRRSSVRASRDETAQGPDALLDELVKAEEEEEEDEFDMRKCGIGTLCVAMLISAAAIFTTYYVEKEKIGKKYAAVGRMREFLVNHNQSWQELNDSLILYEALKLMDNVMDAKERTQKAQDKIDEVIRKINEGWKVFGGSLYYIDPKQTDFAQARKECESLDTVMATVPDRNTELFLETESKTTQDGIWIGLEKVNKKWTWLYDNLRFTKSFWMPGRPDAFAPIEENCVEIKNKCEDPAKCWNNISCIKKRNAMCRMDPDPNLVS